MKMSGLGSGESKLETAISYLLIWGVIASLVLELAWMATFYYTYGQLSISHDQGMFIQGRDFFSFLFDQFKDGRGQSTALRLMTAGIITLILTPYVRVIISAFYFARERDYKYALITLFVLIVVTISLALH